MARPLDSWDEKPGPSDLTASDWYRCWLFGEGRTVLDGEDLPKRRGLSDAEVAKEGGLFSLRALRVRAVE